MRIKQSIEINRPVAQVWAVLADPCQDPRWCRKVKSVERVSEDSWRVIHKPVPLRPPMQLSLVIVDTDAPRRMTLREEDEAAVFDVEYSLEPAPAGTRFTQVSDIRWKKLPRWLHATFRRGVERDVRGQQQALRSLLER